MRAHNMGDVLSTKNLAGVHANAYANDWAVIVLPCSGGLEFNPPLNKFHH